MHPNNPDFPEELLDREGEEEAEGAGLFMWRDEEGHRAWGVEFPDGQCALLWDIESWPAEEQLHGPHLSLYATVGDVLHANGGSLEWGSWE